MTRFSPALLPSNVVRLSGITVFGLRFTGARADHFDDLLGCISEGEVFLYPGTTSPGLYWLQNPMRKTGCARLKPGYYKSCWRKGLHKGKPGLVQSERAEFIVQRDNNLDEKFDHTAPEYHDTEGLNMHRAGVDSQLVGKWSAGCQVFKREADFLDFWSKVQKDKYTFVSYQLILMEGTADEYIRSIS